MKAHDFLADAFKKRSKVGSGFYQFHYGHRGWISVVLKSYGPNKGKWDFTVCRHTRFEEFPVNDNETVVLGVGEVETVRQEGYYPTMKEALDAAEYYLLTDEQKDTLNAYMRLESSRVLAELEARIAATKPIWDDLRARGVVK